MEAPAPIDAPPSGPAPDETPDSVEVERTADALDINEACAEWAMDYCGRREVCAPISIFDLTDCVAVQHVQCQLNVAFVGSEFDLDGLLRCREGLDAVDCYQLFAANDFGYVERCAPSTGSLPTAEPCIHYHQCQSGVCSAQRDEAGQSCRLCREDDSEVHTSLVRFDVAPTWDEYEAEGDPATDGQCNNPLLRPVEGACLPYDPEPYEPCAFNACPDSYECHRGACAQPSGEGEPCDNSDRECRLDLHCEEPNPDVPSDLGNGTCREGSAGGIAGYRPPEVLTACLE
jgi:hypothetical protein